MPDCKQPRHTRLAALALLALVPAWANAFQIDAENDGVVTSGDRHYTQGARLMLDARPLDPATDSLWRRSLTRLPLLPASPDSQTALQWIVVGQQLYTPDHVDISTPQTHDRPYAGWLYTGAALFNVQPRRYARLELLAGIVGPSAGGEVLQNGFHETFGFGKADGWSMQLPDRPVVVATYEQGWSLPLAMTGKAELSLVPQFGLTVGNLFDNAHLALLLRWGTLNNMRFGPDLMRDGYAGLPVLTNDHASPGSWAFWAGTFTKNVWQNSLLQGYDGHAGVPHEQLVNDVLLGAAVTLSPHWQLAVSALDRSKEFQGQQGHDRYGGVTLVRRGF